MGLHVVATPIGHPGDLSPRAKELIKQADYVIGEEMKPTTGLLKTHELTPKKIQLLNEHSQKEDLDELLELCKSSNVVLVSDCGTPGFCDPGADLVNLCRKNHIPVFSAPGPSSLATFLSICGHRLDQFFFRGFLPAKDPMRKDALEELNSSKYPTILMDTPYRLQRLMDELCKHLNDQNVVLGVNLSTDGEKIYEGTASELKSKHDFDKAEFILAVLPSKKSKSKDKFQNKRTKR